jgi:nitrile hydratase
MDGVHDMGGTEGWGRVTAPDPEEPVFAQPWEGRAFAITAFTMGRISGRNLDAFRHALERLDRDAYLDRDGYWARWLNAAELMLVDSSIIAPGAIEARVRRNAGEDVTEPPAPEPSKPDYAATGPGSLRQVDAEPRFAVGDRVRTRSEPSEGHTKLPAYARGHTGVVESIQPGHLLPDTHAHFRGENPQHVYTVRFDSTELWGADAEPFALTLELYESYLEDV